VKPVAVALLVFGLSPLSAQERGDEICYSRVYSTAHLGEHPHQLAPSMKLSIRRLDTPAPEWLAAVTMRGNADEYIAGGTCSKGPILRCDVECGGGTIGIKPLSGTSSYVYLEPPWGSGSISFFSCHKEMTSAILKSGEDDKVFLLDKRPLKDCTQINGGLSLLTPSPGDGLRHAFLGDWGSVMLKENPADANSDGECVERARVSSRMIDRDALGQCRIDSIERQPDAIEWNPLTIKVLLSCDGMYDPLEQMQIWSTFRIKGEAYMTQTTVQVLKGFASEEQNVKLEKHFSTDLLRKCRPH
jgi:hypothetical protein